MSEVSSSHPEQRFSTEQQLLISTAHELLTSPETIMEGPYYSRRPTTKKEKIQSALGKITGRGEVAGQPPRSFFEVAIIERKISVLGIRGITEKDGPRGWGGGVYLKQDLIKDLNTGDIDESLTLYAFRIIDNDYAFTQVSAMKEDVLWSVNLLAPIDNQDEVARLQAELNEAMQR